MKHWKVTIEIIFDESKNVTKEYFVDAGNKKIASLRAMAKAAGDGYSDNYKKLKNVEEIVLG